MTKFYQLGGQLVPFMPSHNGGTTITCDGTAAVITAPTGSSLAYLRASGGAGYYNVGTAAAGTASYGYVAKDTVDIVGPCDNLTALNVFGAAGVLVHIQWYTA